MPDGTWLPGIAALASYQLNRLANGQLSIIHREEATTRKGHDRNVGPTTMTVRIRKATQWSRKTPVGAKIMLAVFLFTAGYSLFHVGKRIVTHDPHLISGGVIFTAVSVPMILICWDGDPSNPGPERRD